MRRTEMGMSGAAIPLDLAWLGYTCPKLAPHISVCICTFRKPRMLRRLLFKLNNQVTEDLFTYSIVVADNDDARSGAPVIAKLSNFKVPIRYCVEPRRSTALALNKAIGHAEGAFVAIIDDDEFPEPTWLLTLFKTLYEHRVDGVLGAVKLHFEEVPPVWLRRSGIYSRKVMPTGTVVQWMQSRTGNALLKRGMVICDPMPFRPECRSGEEQDFFRRKIEAGYRFVWSAEAVVSETITPAQWKRGYVLRNAILRGATAARQPRCTTLNCAWSLITALLLLPALPVALFLGQEYFMRLMVKICDHSGRVLMHAGFVPIWQEHPADQAQIKRG